MRTRRILLRGAIAAAALGSVSFGISAEAAQASPLTECARWASEAARYADIGASYTKIGNTLSAAGQHAAARDAWSSAELAFGWSASYDTMWRRTCQIQ